MEIEEDDIEQYNREFQRKRWEKKKAEEEENLRKRKKTFQQLRVINIFILLFALLLEIDDRLPRKVSTEIGERSWTISNDYRHRQRTSGPRHITYLGMVKTNRRVIAVYNGFSRMYPSSSVDSIPLIIFTTPILRTPRTAEYTVGGQTYQSTVYNTVYETYLYFPAHTTYF
jgi:hypothetical protein